MRKLFVFLFLALFAGFLSVPESHAQSEASVQGTVRDPQGAAVPDAKVTLTHTATGVSQETHTNTDGIFAFPYVIPGRYSLTIQKEGFRTTTTTVTPAVAEKVNLTFALEIGQVSESVTVSESAVPVNTINGELAYDVTGQALTNLPLLNRNYYQLMQLAPGAVNTGDVTGDTRGTSSTAMAGAGGLSVSGARTSSVNYMLDGGDNNDTFVTGPSQIVPLDSVQEFKVQTNGADASYGRNPIETNAVTKSGTNSFHGSAYEYYRGAALSTTPFFDKANQLPKANFVRNQFGGSFGGPIKRDKLFFFAAAEAIRVGGSSQNLAYVPSQAWLNAANPSVVSYLNSFGGVPASNCNNAPINARFILETLEGAPAGSYGTSPATTLFNQAGAAIPADTILFCQAPFKTFTDVGGGLPQNTYFPTGRVDWNFSPNTSFFGRYSYLNLQEPAGTGNPSASFSPYPVFNSPFVATNQNATLALTHSFSPNLYGELRMTYSRVNNLASPGQAPVTSPCWQYANGAGATPSGNSIDFPGYFPTSLTCSFAGGLPTGGPQNIWQFQGSATKVMGKHSLQFGANYWNMRFNYTFGAFQQGYYQSDTMQAMLNGQIDFLEQAINPRGLVPGQTYCTGPNPCTVSVPNSTPAATTTVPANGPLVFPSFTRHYIYNEFAVFAQDAWKVTPRLTLNYGLRWEYFGIQHSIQKERNLDWNLYYNLVGGTTPRSPVFEQIQNARFTQTNQFYQPQYDNFGPRIGLAYDLTGHGTTVFRAAYGIYYDRNFGNATFNVIQNPSPYAVLAGTTLGVFGASLPIAPDERNIINAAGGQFTISSSARQLFTNLKTAYNQQWNATVEHNMRGVLFGASYVGIHGVHLYSLNNLNPIGGCLLLVQVEPSTPCDPTSSGRISRINQSGVTGMNQRANAGFSFYDALQTYVRSSQIGKTGLTLNGSYSLSHSIDNESSFFADALFEGIFGFGFKNPFAPSLDKASSTNDIRNRAAISGVWELPWLRNAKGLEGQTLGGWSLAGIFTIQSGAAFTVYNGDTTSQCFNNGTNFCYPVLTSSAALPPKLSAGSPASIIPGAADSFKLFDLANAPYQTQTAFCAANSLNTPLGPFGGPTASADSQLGCTSALYNLFPNLLAGRNQYRTPGIWNVDFSAAKVFRMPKEGHQLRFQADFLNIFNHSNLYAVPGTNKFAGTGSAVLSTFGVTNSAILERRNIQLSLRYQF